MKERPIDEPSLKLQLLQESDTERPWESLDDSRHCILCEKTICGHTIKITRDRQGRTQLRCPTTGCRATPSEWVHPENPLVSEEAWRDWVRLLDSLCDDDQKRGTPPRRFRPSDSPTSELDAFGPRFAS